MGSLRYIQNYSLKLNDHWHWWMVMLGAMPVEILTAKLNSLSKNTNKWLTTTSNISQHLYFFVRFGSLSIDHPLSFYMWDVRLACNFSSFTAAVGQTHFFSIWQTITRGFEQGSSFHFPLPLPLTYTIPQFSNPGPLGSPVIPWREGHSSPVEPFKDVVAVGSYHSKPWITFSLRQTHKEVVLFGWFDDWQGCS